MRISIIAAMDEKRGIGKNNKLLWHIPEDLKRFKRLTTGHPIIMGRKTFESIGRVLPSRTNIIITRDPNYRVEGAIVVNSLEEGIEKAEKMEAAKGTEGTKGTRGEIFVIGGGQIFAQALALADRLYLTIVKGDFRADTFFPDYSAFKKLLHKEKRESQGYEYMFVDLER